jgi:putative transposase
VIQLPRSSTPSFVTTIPLVVSASEDRELMARFNAARNLYNACLSEANKRMELVRNSDAYQLAKATPKEQKKLRSERFNEARTAYRYSDYDLQSYACNCADASIWIAQKLDKQCIQKIATRAFKASERVLFRRAKSTRFKQKHQFKSVEGKSNKQGIRWQNEKLVWGKLKLNCLIDSNDPVMLHGLNSPVKYVRLLWKQINGKRRWYVQLINEGTPFVKPKNKLGSGIVGIDLNVSVVGVVSDSDADLKEFCSELNQREKEIRAFQRQMQRSQRTNNPDNYEPDFQARRGNRIVTKKGKNKKGKRHWKRSNRYLKIRAKKAELQRKQREHRKSLQGHLVNEVLPQGHHFKMEKVSVKAWQKNWGRQIGYKAPGEFQSRLIQKAESAAGIVERFSTQKTRLSQTCQCGRIQKKSLSERVHRCECGIEVKRDVYSAFLSRSVTDHQLVMPSVFEDWGRLETVLRQV